jgi:hypothetical protein
MPMPDRVYSDISGINDSVREILRTTRRFPIDREVTIAFTDITGIKSVLELYSDGTIKTTLNSLGVVYAGSLVYVDSNYYFDADSGRYTLYIHANEETTSISVRVSNTLNTDIPLMYFTVPDEAVFFLAAWLDKHT